MILYTVMPQEMMFHNEKDYGKQSVVTVNGVSLLAEKREDDNWVVVRLLSSDPSHYLNASISPGQILQSNLSLSL